MIVPFTPKLSDVSSVPLLDVARGNQPLKTEIMDAISSIIDSGRFIGGPFVESLEQTVAEVSHAQFGIGCASGSDALLLALMAIGIEAGDEVICPSFTFFATASAIHRLGGVPVFVDIEPETFNIDVTKIEQAITSRTKAIIPVHLFGQCCDMDPILEIAAKKNLKIIEDCAQSIGASDRGRRAGSMGAVGCFSFYPTKNIGGFGDGGMMTTNDADIADRLRLLANHGMRPRYFHQAVGINSRLDAMQAAVLTIKMNHFESYCQRRTENAENYQQLIAQSGLAPILSVPQSSFNCEHVWNQFTVRIPDGRRNEVRQRLAEMQIGSEIYYPIPLHEQDCFNYLAIEPGSLPETELAASEVLSLPIFPELTSAEQQYVVQSLAKVISTPAEHRKAA
jgi:dTDP-4-amino-4,6-dideoxygalactose transaminase